MSAFYKQESAEVPVKVGGIIQNYTKLKQIYRQVLKKFHHHFKVNVSSTNDQLISMLLIPGLHTLQHLSQGGTANGLQTTFLYENTSDK